MSQFIAIEKSVSDGVVIDGPVALTAVVANYPSVSPIAIVGYPVIAPVVIIEAQPEAPASTGTLQRKATTDGSIVIVDTSTGEEFPI